MRGPSGLDAFETLTGEVEAAARRMAGESGAALPAYTAAKAKAIAGFTLLIGEAHAAGRLEGAALEAELRELDRMVARYARVMAAASAVARERERAAVEAVLWSTLERIAGPAVAVLPLILRGP
ncbi:MAG: hypothetical protein ACFBSD_01460 [Paracoccaceae bacterium]